MEDPKRTDEAIENEEGESGAEGGTESESYDAPPGKPTDDDAPAGDTDQHSDAPPDTFEAVE